MDIRERITQLLSQPVQVDIAGFGQVFIRRITVGEADEFQKEQTINGEVLSGNVRALARIIGNEHGVPVFDPNKPDDLTALRGIPLAVAQAILTESNKVNAPSVPDLEKKA